MGLALFGLTDYFIAFLVALGIVIPPIAGIYVTDYFMRGRNYDIEALERNAAVRLPAVAGWVSGALAAYWSARGQVVLTGIPTCDSVFLSALIFALLSMGPRLMGRGRRRPEFR